jgi:hypothetical protein
MNILLETNLSIQDLEVLNQNISNNIRGLSLESLTGYMSKTTSLCDMEVVIINKLNRRQEVDLFLFPYIIFHIS